MQVANIQNTAANAAEAAARTDVRVVPQSYTQAVGLNAGAVVIVKDGVSTPAGRYKMVSLHPEESAEVNGIKLHFAVLIDENDDAVVVTLAPSVVIDMFNGASEIGEFDESNLVLPALPASATKKVKAPKEAKVAAPTKRNFADAIYMDMHTFARLTGTAAPRPVDVTTVLMAELGQQKAGAGTYYRQTASNLHMITPDAWKASAARVEALRIKCAEDGVELTPALIGKNAKAAVIESFQPKVEEVSPAAADSNEDADIAEPAIL